MNQLVVYFLLFSTQMYLTLTVETEGKKTYRLQILHNNDLHARFDEMEENTAPCPQEYVRDKKCFGGFARMKKAADDARAAAAEKGTPSIFLNAGDNFSGSSPYFTMFNWKIVQQLTDELELDAMAVGSHEFKNKIEDFAEFLKVGKTPVVCSNLGTTNETDRDFSNLARSITLERTFEGEKIIIGVIGYTSQGWKMGKLKVLHRLTAIRDEAIRLREKKNAKFIIALGHAGFEEDIKIAEEVKEINLVVGGESHFLLYTPIDKPPSIEKAQSEYPKIVMVGKKDKEEDEEKPVKVPVVQAYAYGKYLGILEVEFDDNGHVSKATGNPKLLDSEVGKDIHLNEKVSEWTKKIVGEFPEFKKIIAHTRTSLKKPYYDEGEFESNLANLVTDAFIDWGVHQAKKEDPTWTRTPISFYPAGGLRINISKDRVNGALTVEDLMSIMPFPHPMVEITETGKTIKDFLEYNLSLYDKEGSGFKGKHFIHFSGLRVKYDLTKPYKERVVSAEALCKECDVPKYHPIEDNKYYSIITQNTEANKFEKQFQKALERTDHKIRDIDVLIEYVKRRGVIAPYLNNRVVVDGFHPKKHPSLPDMMEIDGQ